MTIQPDGRRMLRVEERNAATPVDRKPSWMRTTIRTGPEYRQIQGLVDAGGLHTVCQEAGCPNISECWEAREATFLIGGSSCTRRCDFCQIASGRPDPLDTDEPRRVAESIRSLDLRYATVTGVTRDDLPDEGAWLYAQTISEIHTVSPQTGVEILVPDFSGKPELLAQVFDASPEVFGHNLETVPRLFRRIRPAFGYDRSLDVLRLAHAAGMVTKSNLILGMGETREEITQALRDLRDASCDLVTITQYLRPSKLHLPVDRWVHPEEFVELRSEAEELGFVGVMSGPLVRSSYRAGTLWAQAVQARSPEPTAR
jgi:lipoyl synthase